MDESQNRSGIMLNKIVTKKTAARFDETADSMKSERLSSDEDDDKKETKMSDMLYGISARGPLKKSLYSRPAAATESRKSKPQLARKNSGQR